MQIDLERHFYGAEGKHNSDHHELRKYIANIQIYCINKLPFIRKVFFSTAPKKSIRFFFSFLFFPIKCTMQDNKKAKEHFKQSAKDPRSVIHIYPRLLLP